MVSPLFAFAVSGDKERAGETSRFARSGQNQAAL
jgi:hypothetical protein